MDKELLLENKLKNLAKDATTHQRTEAEARIRKVQTYYEIDKIMHELGIVKEGYRLNINFVLDYVGHNWYYNMGSLTIYLPKDPGETIELPALPLLSSGAAVFKSVGNLLLLRVLHFGENALVLISKHDQKYTR